MNKKEKVIKGLECCITDGPDCPNDCPYLGDCNRKQLHTDALVFLKAQEPRVMTLEEIRTTKPAMYIMYKSEDGEGYLHEYALFSRAHDGVTEMIVADSNRPLVALIDADYGKVWICWTSRPAEPQMEATLWAQTNG